MKGWKTLLFALLVAVGGVLQTFNWATVIPQDQTWSGIVMVAIAAAIAALRVVTTTPVGKAVAGWLLFGFAALLIQPARAADMPLKAPALSAPICTISQCSGWYLGGNVVNTGGNFDVVGSGLTGLASNGLMFGGQAGYEFWNGSWFAAAELDAEYDITSNMPAGGGLGFGNSGQYALGGQVKLGYALANLFGAGATGSAAPTLPQQLANALISPYIAVGAWDRPWGVGLATGAGVQALIATNWTLDAEYLHINYNNAQVNPIVSEQTENLFLLALSRHL